MIILLFFICFWIGLSIRHSVILFVFILALVTLIVFYRYKKKIGIICLGIAFIGVGISYIRFDFQRTDFSGLIIDSHDNYFIILSKGEKLYTYHKNNEYEIGDYVQIKGEKNELDFVTLESQFDFKDYLNKKGVYYQIKTNKITAKFSNPLKIRKTRNKFLSHFSEENQSLIKALMFSERDSGDDLNSIEKLHLARLANASGIYIYAYLHFISFILSYFIKNKRLKIISLLTLSPYLIFTFPRFTIFRIMVMELARYINEAFLDKKIKSLEITGIVGIFFLLCDYHNGYQMSFILGFSMPILISFIRDSTFMYKRFKKKIIQMVMIYFAFIPFEIKFYNGINPLSLIVQTLFSPLFIFISVLCLICFYGLPIYGFTEFFINGISNLLGWLSKIAFQINVPPFNEWIVFVYMLLYLAYCYYKSIEFIPLYRLFAGLIVGGLVIYHLPIYNLMTAQVSFINVGQGDSCLVRKGNTTVLIDTGGLSYTDIAKETLIPFFQKQRIYNIDLVITTHDDYDHSGAYDSLKENFYVKQKIDDATKFPVKIGGLTFKNYNSKAATYSEENDKSLVIGFELMNKHFLIMGDAPTKVERQIIKENDHLDCDILKVGHHGSDTSTCEEFIKYLQPKVGVISCGKNNKYGHPKSSVLSILKKYNVEIRRTDVEGTITYRNYIFM